MEQQVLGAEVGGEVDPVHGHHPPHAAQLRHAVRQQGVQLVEAARLLVVLLLLLLLLLLLGLAGGLLLCPRQIYHVVHQRQTGHDCLYDVCNVA